MKQVLRFLANAFGAAGLIVGTAIGGASIAAIIARQYGVELPPFPETVLGIYLKLRFALFDWWTPEWWGQTFSDLLVLYIAIAVALFRGLIIRDKFVRANLKRELTNGATFTRLGRTPRDELMNFYYSALWPIFLLWHFDPLKVDHWMFTGDGTMKKIDTLRGGLLTYAATIVTTIAFALLLLAWEQFQSAAGF